MASSPYQRKGQDSARTQSPFFPRHSSRDGDTAGSKSEDDKLSPALICYVMLSVVLSATNQITFKKLLNRFSAVDDSNKNLEFFVSQWSTVLYMIQASALIVWRFCIRKGAEGPKACTSVAKTSQKTFFFMGILDGASSTLAAIGGALTPGQLQTLLNQTVIPMTMVCSFGFIGTRFKAYQLTGAAFIVLGSCAAALPFLTEGGGLSGGFGGHTSNFFSIMVFAISVIPAAVSNVYKEASMKEDDLDVYVTTTFVSVWQELAGFLFLPMLALPALGGLGWHELMMQVPDGLSCFAGNSPSDAYACEGATYLFMVYVLVNFLYNVVLLVITKEGSAVLLVVANALALPITNLAFSVTLLMGDEAEPFTTSDIVGLVFVCGGFLIYSSFGLAKRFYLVQGTPGQMTFTPMDGWDGATSMVLTPSSALDPQRHAKFLRELMGGSFSKDSTARALEIAKNLVKTLERQALAEKEEVNHQLTLTPTYTYGSMTQS